MTVRLEVLQGIQCKFLHDAIDDVRHGGRIRSIDQRVGIVAGVFGNETRGEKLA
jgi:hypothetical protein